MIKINPYLNFPGTTEEAFNFYRSIFGGEFTTIMRFRDVEGNDKMPPEALDKIMHIALPVGGSIIMATDALESLDQHVKEGNNHYICIGTESTDEADRIFNALKEGGVVEIPLEKMFWGSYFGALKDRYGIQWMVDCVISK